MLQESRCWGHRQHHNIRSAKHCPESFLDGKSIVCHHHGKPSRKKCSTCGMDERCTQGGCGTSVGRAPFPHPARDEAPSGMFGEAPRVLPAPHPCPCPASAPEAGQERCRYSDSTRNCRAREAPGGRQMRARRETSKKRSDAGGRGTRRWICPNMEKIAARLRQWRARGGWAGAGAAPSLSAAPAARRWGKGSPRACWRGLQGIRCCRWATPVSPSFWDGECFGTEPGRDTGKEG